MALPNCCNDPSQFKATLSFLSILNGKRCRDFCQKKLMGDSRYILYGEDSSDEILHKIKSRISVFCTSILFTEALCSNLAALHTTILDVFALILIIVTF